jgi:hypothetical protein
MFDRGMHEYWRLYNRSYMSATLGFSHTLEGDEISKSGRHHKIGAFGPFVTALLIGMPLVL